MNAPALLPHIIAMPGSIPRVLVNVIAGYAGLEWELRPWIRDRFPHVLDTPELYSNPRAREYAKGPIDYRELAVNPADWAVDMNFAYWNTMSGRTHFACANNTNPGYLRNIDIFAKFGNCFYEKCGNPSCETIVLGYGLYRKRGE